MLFHKSIPSPLNIVRNFKKNAIWLYNYGMPNTHIGVRGNVVAVFRDEKHRLIEKKIGESKLLITGDKIPNILSLPLTKSGVPFLTSEGVFLKKIGTNNLVTNAGDASYANAVSWAHTKHVDPVSEATEGRGTITLWKTMILGNPASPSTPAKADNYSSLLNPIADSQKLLYGWNEEEGDSLDPYLYPRVDDNDPDNTGAGADKLSWKFTWYGADFEIENPDVKVKEGVITTPNPAPSSDILTHFVFDSDDYFWKNFDTLLKIFNNHEFFGVS